MTNSTSPPAIDTVYMLLRRKKQWGFLVQLTAEWERYSIFEAFSLGNISIPQIQHCRNVYLRQHSAEVVATNLGLTSCKGILSEKMLSSLLKHALSFHEFAVMTIHYFAHLKQRIY